ncbi:hypothetical protein AURDEDRAFT_70885, partial [Auricularia subglabra TFB-10046 SS5]
MPAPPPQAPFCFRTPLGIKTLRKILRPLLDFDPHDFLLDWTATILDGEHLLGITATGDGKSCMTYFPLLVMQYYAMQKEKPAGWAWPDNPMVLVICPTKCIEEEQEADMIRFSIQALALNQDRLHAARLNNVNLWEQASAQDMLFLGPELLSTAGFAALVKDGDTWSRIVLACIDEAHLVLEWSRNGFRPRFLQIGQLLARLCPKARFCALSATVLPGLHERRLCEALGLFYDDVAVIRRTNMRANVQFEHRLLKSSLSGYAFPELDWTVAEGQSSLIFVDSMHVGWRIAGYLCSLLPDTSSEDLRRRVRIYNSLNDPEHNESTRELLRTWPGTIAVATNALCVGFNSSLIDNVVIINPTSLTDVVQKGGRVNRVAGGGDRVGRAVIYFTSSAYKAAATIASGGSAPPNGLAMSPELARAVVAPCFHQAINDEFSNPRRPSPCSCTTCGGHPVSGDPRPCACSGCKPE